MVLDLHGRLRRGSRTCAPAHVVWQRQRPADHRCGHELRYMGEETFFAPKLQRSQRARPQLPARYSCAAQRFSGYPILRSADRQAGAAGRSTTRRSPPPESDWRITYPMLEAEHQRCCGSSWAANRGRLCPNCRPCPQQPGTSAAALPISPPCPLAWQLPGELQEKLAVGTVTATLVVDNQVEVGTPGPPTM